MQGMRLALVMLFAAGNVALFLSSPFWYLQAAFLGLFLIAAWLSLIRSFDGFFVLCAGEPAVFLAGTVSPGVAVALQLLLVAILTEGTGFLRSARDGAAFAIFCLITAGITAGLLTFRHVFLPLLIIGIAAMIAIGICWLAEYQYTSRFRRSIP